MRCNICGGEEFAPGFGGRLASGKPPMCVKCRSLERQRVVRKVVEALRPLFKESAGLQFVPDQSVDKAWFKSFVGHPVGRSGDIDPANTKLPDGSFDVLVANHVLQLLPNDKAALREWMRLVGRTGLAILTVPSPVFAWETDDWGFADAARNGHFRRYGADFPQRFVRDIKGLHCAAVSAFDDVTGAGETVYCFAHGKARLAEAAPHWSRRGFPVTHLY
jgi:SAM-dependent methyltransferase